MSIDLTDFNAAINQHIANLSGENLKRVADAAGTVILQAVEARAPVASGALKASLDQLDSAGKHRASSAIQVEDSAKGGAEFYAVMLEYGTSKMAAKPFMRPAFEASKDAAEQAAIAAASNLITGI
jgi:HK97 gp10 family phage protein